MILAPRFRLLFALLVLLAAGACGSASRRSGATQGARTTVRVENRNFLDMNVYVLRSSQRIRLGTVPGNSTRVLTIPSHLVFGSTPLRFLADPIGSNRTPISSEITVTPGDEVVLYLQS